MLGAAMFDQVAALPGVRQERCVDCGAERRPGSCVPPLSLTIHADADGQPTVVTASGEIDFGNSPALGQILQEALDHSADGVEVDLAGIGFCDCSGLNVLLHMRRRAREAAKTLTVRASGPTVQRLLALTGTVDELTATDTARTPRTGGDRAPCGPEHDADRTIDGIRAEIEQLRRAMQTRPAIDVARGILMAAYTISAEQAWQVLVTTSQTSNTKLSLLAETLMNTVHGDNLPEPLASHLAKALQEHGGLSL
ncbi:anti-anti-sigma factor [Streptomyces canus]|uniref:anti-sigma factor antagonist n=1 Tax=Streptomyces canus TaxID=58343 RepID=UPI002783B3DB|nr:anti-sigma factor antagonist [Streptomyces canus]MDQ0604631.1 anti-anti-sigma factor [Streptomyces canus]